MSFPRKLFGVEPDLARKVSELLVQSGAVVNVEEDGGLCNISFIYNDAPVVASNDAVQNQPFVSTTAIGPWQQLIGAIRLSETTSAQKIALLSQCTLESKRGQSLLARRHFNFAGIKYKSRMQGFAEPVDYVASDGEGVYCKFSSAETFVKGYWHFIESGPYDGWQEYKNDAAAYIRFISSKYAEDQEYREKVIKLLSEAESLLSGGGAATDGAAVDGADTGFGSNEESRPIRLAVVVGHNSRQPGASAVAPIGKSEFPFNNAVADAMVAESAHYNIVAKRFNRIYTGSYTSEIRDVYTEVDSWGPTCAIELHFNSAGPDATGTEVLYGGNKSKILAAELAQEIKSVLGLPLRNGDGTRLLQNGDRGYASVVALSIPTVLAEPFFGSNRYDCVKVASSGEAALGRAYLRAIRDWGANQ